MGKFESLFTALDKHMGKLQICSYGLSDTTLEEVLGLLKLWRHLVFKNIFGSMNIFPFFQHTNNAYLAQNTIRISMFPLKTLYPGGIQTRVCCL
jgi:hypothetical protein